MSSQTAALSETIRRDACAEGGGGGGEGRPDALHDRQLRMLDELAEIGLQIARAVERRVADADPAAPLAELDAAAKAYARAARAVRQSILLRSRLIEDRRKQDEADRSVVVDRRREHAGRVRRIIARMARDVGEEAGVAEALAWEAGERLESDDIYGAVLNRPVGELVALICRDLGVDPDWSLWAHEAWAGAAGGLAERTWPPPPAQDRGEDAGTGDPSIAADAAEGRAGEGAQRRFCSDTG